MKKIITAINNPKINEELKKEENFEIIGKDLLYKEAILEILEKNNNIDIIILSENLMGEIKLEKLIEEIKNINEKIKIIFILEKENNEIEKILIENQIKNIYYNKKIDLKELIKIINEKEISKKEENTKAKKENEKKFIEKQEELENKETKIRRNMLTKMITFSGISNSGKTTLALVTSKCLSQKNNKVLLIDGDLKKQDLSLILKCHIQYKKRKVKRFKINYIYKNKKLKSFQKNIYYYKIKNELNFFTEKINNNLFFFKPINNILKYNKKIINIFFEIINQKYNFIIIDLSKENLENTNKIFLEKSSINFILLESNLLNIKEIKELIKKYIEEWNININNIKIILNKKNILSMNKNLIKKNLPIKNKILEIKENKLYSILMNQLFKNNKLLEDKKIKENINIIIKEI